MARHGVLWFCLWLPLTRAAAALNGAGMPAHLPPQVCGPPLGPAQRGDRCGGDVVDQHRTRPAVHRTAALLHVRAAPAPASKRCIWVGWFGEQVHLPVVVPNSLCGAGPCERLHTSVAAVWTAVAWWTESSQLPLLPVRAAPAPARARGPAGRVLLPTGPSSCRTQVAHIQPPACHFPVDVKLLTTGFAWPAGSCWSG